MMPTWSGAAGVVAQTVTELVGAGRWWGRGKARGQVPTPVVVGLSGGSAEDALRLMERLSGCQTRLPVNNPTALRDKSRDDEAVERLLDDVARWYSYPGRCRRRRPIRFRRLRMMQAAYEAWGRGKGVGAEQVQRLQRECEQAAYKERGGLLVELNALRGQSLANDMKAAAAVYATGAVLAALTLVPLIEFLVRHVWVHRPARRWFQKKFGVETPQGMYELLCKVQEHPESWNQWLTDAFLADIDAYYHWWRRLNRSRLPLLLMPAALEGKPGGELLRLLRAPQAGETVPRHISPVVLAHTGEEPGEPIVTPEGMLGQVLQGGHTFQTPPMPEQESNLPPVSAIPGPVSTSLSAATIAALVAAGLVVAPDAMAGMRCGQGLSLSPQLTERDGQCIGVTDGGSGSEFMPELAAVSRQIKAENAAAEKSSRFATVAFMIPMSPGSKADRAQVLNEVKGAYLAQYEANNRPDLSDRQPKIRLVLANPGRDYEHWKPVTDQLVAMADDPGQNLREVTGFNLSVDNTAKALKTLTDAHIPVVGGPITADDIASYPGMARIVPNNSEQAAALVSHNRRTPPEDSVLVVDTRANDMYNKSLAGAFRKAVPSSSKDQQFTSPSPNEVGDTANDFHQIAQQICNSGAHNVYFAGRPLHLRVFLTQLAAAPCGGRRYKVITGSGATTVALQLDEGDWNDLAKSHITVEYSAPGHPDEWSRGGLTGAARKFYVSEPPSPKQEMDYVKQRNRQLGEPMGGAADLADSRALTSHDAVYLAAMMIKNAYVPQSSALPTLQQVAKQRLNTYRRSGVAGSTGWFCLDNEGNPYNKAVAIVSLDPATKVRFETLAWPKRKPSIDCNVPPPA